MKRNLLIRDGDYEQALDKMGFCVVPLFSSSQIESIKALHQQFAKANPVTGLKASHSKMEPEMSLKLSHAIKEIVMPSLDKWFKDYDFFLGGFMVKEANTPDEFPLHQDWNIVDESKYTSYQIWIPLELSHPRNGGMYVLPGSHRFFDNYRSGSYTIPAIDCDDNVRPLVTDMIIPPGEALIYHNSLFHASFPNNSEVDRISAIVNIYQKEAPLEYTQKKEEPQQTDIYPISTNFFLTHLSILEKGDLPPGSAPSRSTGPNPVENLGITSMDLIEKYNDYFGNESKSFEPRQLQILKDQTLEEKIRRDGYAVLDLLDLESVDRLNKEYIKLYQSANTSIGRFTPMEHSTPASKRYIHNFILDTIRPKLDIYFKDYQTPIASYFTKYARSAGDLSWHTDASIMLNTHLEPHYGIWCPLVDVNDKNGALCVIERSHKYGHVVFLSGLSWPYSPYYSMFDQVKKVVHIKAGQMVLFDLRLIHHATPNDSDEDRVVFCVRLTHRKSKYYSFVSENANDQVVSVFEEEPDYYLRDDWSGTNQAANRNKKVGVMHQVYSQINYAAIEKALDAAIPHDAGV